MFGLDPDTVRNIKQAFAKTPAIDKVILYGSRAKGNHRNGSDIDITLIGKKMGKNLTLNNSVYPLMDELEALNLPYIFDISIFSDIDNEHLIEHINRIGKVFYQREKGLPDGWEVKRLGEVCEIIAGQSPEGKYYNSEENGLPFYQGKKEFTDKYIGEPTKWTTKVTKEAKENDILMSVRAPVGPINFSTQRICIGRGLAAIRTDELIDKEFLFSFLLKHENEIIGNTGAVFNSINKKQIEDIEIPLSPLPEQKRIVAILDQAFTAIDKAKANTEQNLKNAREVFQSELQEVLSDKKWSKVKLGEVCNKMEYGSSSKSASEGELPVLRMGNIQNGKLLWSNIKYSDNEEDNKKYLLKYNDVLFNRTNSPELVGKTAIYKGEMPAIFAGYLIRIHRKENLLDADYLNYFLNSKMAMNYRKKVVISSVNQANINGTKLKTYPLPLPTLSEQKQIVKKLDAISTETKKLETIYQQKITDLDELKKSMLQKAFNGEL